VLVVRAPGRVNIIGDHTDYQEGLCLPVAIDREVTIRANHRSDRRVVVRSDRLEGTVDVPAEGEADPARVEPRWGRTVAAVLHELDMRGRPPNGFDAEVASTIPVGSGLSSSAAFEVACAVAACAVAPGFALDGRELARLAQAAEHRATGMPCGVMDQMASVFGRAGHALLLDCRTLEVEPVPIPESLEIVIVHSGLARRLEESAYAQRRTACEVAAARLGYATLRDASAAEVAADPLARHVVSENARVRSFVAALRAGDLDRCGRLMLESHASLRDDFEVSTPELDALVELLVDEGARGARLTGAGFGGCVVAITEAGAGSEIARRAAARYGRRTGLTASRFAVRAVDGAGIVQ
jgi:galactokinase